MSAICLHDKTVIERYLRKNTDLHIYSIGDLDDFFWPYTTWYALACENSPEAVALLYTGQTIPTLLAVSDHLPAMIGLLESIIHLLPMQFYAHLSLGLERIFQDTHRLESHGEHFKMALGDPSSLFDLDCSRVIPLTISDLSDIIQLYEESYPGNWFDRRMLETNQYFGFRKDDQLISIAGIHVYSEAYGVAALGNITTHPRYRNQGYGTLVTARTCQSLSEKVDHIGLNVKADNRIAVSSYEKLGFEVIASYGEFSIQDL